MTACSSKTAEPITFKIPTTCTYYSLQSAECLNKEQFMKHVEPYKVIFVGDHHHSLEAHQVVIELINGLSKDGYKVLLANEWFSSQENGLLEQYVAGELDSNISKALGWKKRVGYDFNLSEPIFNAVIKEKGILYGINMDKSFRKKISDYNLSGMTNEEKKFVATLDLNVSAHKQLLAPFFSHCHKTRKGEDAQKCMERMYRVQVAWDSMMGEESAKLAEKLQENEKLIVFVGAMHLDSKLGVNLRFARESKIPSITVLPYPKDTQRQKDIAVDLGNSDIIYLYEESTLIDYP